MDKETLTEKCGDLNWLKTMVGSIAEDNGCSCIVRPDQCEVELGFKPGMLDYANRAFGEINEELKPRGLAMKKVVWLTCTTSMTFKIEEIEND